MNTLTLSRLRELRERFGVGVFGKIAQKLLALSFLRIGFTHIVERSVEGVDIDVAGEGDDKFAVEVKTTEGLSITLDDGNVRALRDRDKDGYSPVIAALRLAVFEKWIVAQVPLPELRPGRILVESLRAYRMRGLEDALEPAFEAVVDEHLQATLDSGLQYLSEQLEKGGIEVAGF